MTEPTREQQLCDIVEKLLSIVDTSTMPIASWKKVDELRARYDALGEEAHPEMYLCPYCKNWHSYQAKDWLCPLDPKYRDGWSDKLTDRGY